MYMEAGRLIRRVVQRGQNGPLARLAVLSTHLEPSDQSSQNRHESFSRSIASATALTAAAVAGASASTNEHTCLEEAQREKTALDPKEFVKFKLKERQDLSHNTSLFRFEFDPQATLGLHVASCLVTRAPVGGEGEDGKPSFVIRPYTPISYPDTKGHFDLLIKVYPQGKMSNHIFGLKPGDELEVKGPIPKLPYKPNMKRHIGMIAGGTGITPMLQVIDSILRNPEDNTQVTLLFGNNTPEDVLLKDRLDELQTKHPNFRVFYVVASPDASWQGGVGHVSKDIATKALPPPGDDSLILVCGPPGLMKAISGDKAKDKSQGELDGLLKDLGYTKEQVYKF